VAGPTEFQLFFNQNFPAHKYRTRPRVLALHDGGGADGSLVQAAIGYVTPAVALLRKKSDLDRRSQTHTVSRLDENMLPSGYSGKMDMPRPARWRLHHFTWCGSGIGSTPAAGAAERAQKRAERYYKV